MPEQNNSSNKKLSLDWLMRGILTKLGDTFDRLTGRRWTPSSSLATSELVERLKFLLDQEVKDLGEKGKFVPHNLKLKMQWDKFSTDADKALKKLENELLIAAIDHINDNRYHTYAPIRIEVKPDYFTEGVKLLASFDKFDEEEREVAINVTVPQINNVGNYIPEPAPEEPIEQAPESFIAHYTLHGKSKRTELQFKIKDRRSVGRTKDNDLTLEDASVSKIHAALVLNSERQLMVADTGSTNGTFINDQRIAYGRAFPVKAGDRLKFGNVDVTLEYIPNVSAEIAEHNSPVATMSASQRDIHTIALNSNDHLSVGNQTIASNVAEKATAEPVAPTANEPGEPKNNQNGTQERIVLDFSGDNK